MGGSSADEDPATQLAGFVAAWMLLGAIAMIMMVFYLVNYPDKDIRKATWLTLSNTCSLFCAILIYTAQDQVVALGFPEEGAHRLLAAVDSTTMGGGHMMPYCSVGAFVPSSPRIVVRFVQWLVIYTIVQIAMYVQRKRPKLMAAWGLIGAHMVGFASLSAFYTLMLIDPFDWSGGHSIIVIVICVPCFFVLSRAGMFVRAKLPRDRYSKALEAHCVHAEDEFISFAIGFLISISVRDLLTSCIHSVHWSPTDTGNMTETNSLLGVALGFCVLLIICTQIRRCTKDDDDSTRSAIERLSDMIALTMSMSMGWCLLFWGQWLFWLVSEGRGLIGNGNLMVFSLEVVILFTFCSFFMLIIMDMIADRFEVVEESLRAISEAFMLLLGLSWEGCFMRALSGIQNGKTDVGTSTGTIVGAVFVLCLLVIPAWVLFILPHALVHAEHGHYSGDDDGDHCGHNGSQDGHGGHDAEPIVEYEPAFVHDAMSKERRRSMVSSVPSNGSKGLKVLEPQENKGACKNFGKEDLENPEVSGAILRYLNENGYWIRDVKAEDTRSAEIVVLTTRPEPVDV